MSAPIDPIPPCVYCGGFVISDDEGCLHCSACGQYTGVCADDEPQAVRRVSAKQRIAQGQAVLPGMTV